MTPTRLNRSLPLDTVRTCALRVGASTDNSLNAILCVACETAVYPGLSYTNFSYSNLKVSEGLVSVTIKNTGAVHGAEVVQLYLGFPPSAGEPPQVLRGFKKLHISPGAEATATFQLGAGVSD